MELKRTQSEQKPANPAPAKRPNECGSIAVSGHVKIFDPNTKEVILETRA